MTSHFSLRFSDQTGQEKSRYNSHQAGPPLTVAGMHCDYYFVELSDVGHSSHYASRSLAETARTGNRPCCSVSSRAHHVADAAAAPAGTWIAATGTANQQLA